MKKLLWLAVFALLAAGLLWPRGVNNENINQVSEVTEKSSPAPTGTPEPSPSYYYGKASWYGKELCNGEPCRTANGDWFDENAFTCACDYNIPLGTKLAVSSGENSIEVVCNDRYLCKKNCSRILDLSKKAFETLAPNSKGVIWVRVKEVK